MRPVAQLGQKLGLKLKPNIQQFAAILQQSTLEISQTITERLQSNPLLQMTDEDYSLPSTADNDSNEFEEPMPGLDDDMSRHAENGESFLWETQAGEDSLWSQTLNAQEMHDAGVDGSVSQGNLEPLYHNQERDFYCPTAIGEGFDGDLLSNKSPTTSALDNILEAAKTSATGAQEKWLIEILIGHIDERGWLDKPVPDIAKDIANEIQNLSKKAGKVAPDINWQQSLIKALKIIQQQNPAGIGAQSIQECCLLQVARWQTSSKKETAITILSKHYPLLLKKDWQEIAKAMGVAIKCVTDSVHSLALLTLQPLSDIDSPQYIIPEVIVRKVQHNWVVDVNDKAYPRLKIHTFIARHIYRKRKVENLQGQLREAEQLISDLSARAQIVLKVARYLVAFQRPYFEIGDIGMRALLQKEAALDIGVSESTFSRTIHGKYMDTPMGILPFSFFISKAKSTTDMGGRISVTATRSMIRILIEKESTSNPLRDNTISKQLANEGIILSRRSVAAYREQLGILPYHRRKS